MTNGPGFLENLRAATSLTFIVMLSALLGCGGGTNGSGLHGGGGGGGTGGGPVGPDFFSMHINSFSSPLPGLEGVPIHGVRLWDTQTSWATTNTADGVYNWNNLDKRVNQALGANLDVLYDLARTPAFAQCATNNTQCGSGNTSIVCAYSSGNGSDDTPGDCFPPSDLNTDGTGSDQHWINWVTAVATRYKGQIAYYEIWNEPNSAEFWQGTTSQLVRMAADARCIIIGDKGCNSMSTYPQTGIDPSAKMITPAYTFPVTDIGAYLNASISGVSGTGSSFADVVAFHGYPGAGNPAENVLDDYTNLVNTMSGSQPVFDTEGSWGRSLSGGSNLTDPDQQAAFTARYLIVLESVGVQRMYWYGWDFHTSDDGDLWAPLGTASGLTSAGLTAAGVAYQQTESWLSGATLSQKCSHAGNIWTCIYTRSGGYQALAVWDRSQTCNNGNCTTSSFTLPASPQYTQYQDLAGNTHAISGSTVAIGAKPILLETGNIP
jgi:hypothetical protein